MEPFEPWEAGKWKILLPPAAFFLLGNEATEKKSTEKSYLDIQVLCSIRISNCIVWVEGVSACKKRSGMKWFSKSLLKSQSKIFCDSWYYQLLFIPFTLLTPLHHWSIDCSTAQAKNGWCSLYPSSKQSTPLPDAKTIWFMPVKPGEGQQSYLQMLVLSLHSTFHFGFSWIVLNCVPLLIWNTFGW